MQRHRKTITAIGLAAAICAASAACSTSESNAGLNQPALTASASTTSATMATSTDTAIASTSSLPPIAASSSSSGSPVDYASKPDPDEPTTAAVLKAYRAYSDVKVTMADEANFSTQLKYVATGKAVEDLTSSIASLRQDDVNYIGRPHSDPTVVSISGGKATVHDCFGSPGWIPVYSSGLNKGKSDVAPGAKEGAHVLTATLQQFGEKWLVTDAVAKADLC